MDTEMALLWGFLALLLVVVGTIIWLLVHSGLLISVVVKTCKPDISEVQIAYKFARGPYKESGALFTQVHTLLPEYRTLGVYYDDPKVKQPQKLRYIVGLILAEGPDAVVVPEHRKLLEENGYQFATFPAIDHAVQTSFPFNSTVSIIMAVMKVYPALRDYIEARSLCARPFLEVYDNKRSEILFIGPLAQQDDFYVPEVQQEEDDYRQDDYDDDARTDNSSRSWDESASFVREDTTTTTATTTTTITTTTTTPTPAVAVTTMAATLPSTTTITTTTTTTPLLPPPAPELRDADMGDTGSAGSEESDANTASSFEEIDEREAAAAAAAAATAAAATAAAATAAAAAAATSTPTTTTTTAAAVANPDAVTAEGGEGENREGSVRKDDDEGER